jgi:hypothetical protein
MVGKNYITKKKGISARQLAISDSKLFLPAFDKENHKTASIIMTQSSSNLPKVLPLRLV